MDAGIARRRLLTGALACLFAGARDAQAKQEKKSYLQCRQSIAGPGTDMPLTVDVHCHVFNGDDIPVRNFLQRIILNSDEAGELSQIGGFKAGLVASLVLGGARSDASELEDMDKIFRVRDPLDAACRWYAGRQTGSQRDLPPQKIVQDFARFYTQNRMFNAVDLMTVYPDVHLFTPALVDLFAGAGPPKSVYPKQLEIAERICRLTGGRMHFFAAFDPLRQALHDRNPGAKYMNQLDMVKRAVEERGFIGVKLYPPMGFAPTGNVIRACPSAAHKLFGRVPSPNEFRSEYGELLDAALEQLFSWATCNDVPIMAHAAGSNFSNKACATDDPITPENEGENFDALNAAYYLGNAGQWGDVLVNHPTLRLNLAHYDHEDIFLSKKNNGLTQAAKDLRDLAGRYDNVYLDLSHFDAIKLTDTRNGLKKLLGDPANFPVPGVIDRLMYGSDWHMLARVYGNQFYLQRMRESIPQQIADGFFGRNAINYLGLAPGRENRRRLDDFYRKRNMAPPVWMQVLS